MDETLSRERILKDMDSQFLDMQKSLDSKISELRRLTSEKIATLDGIISRRDKEVGELEACITSKQDELDGWNLKTERLLIEFSDIQRRIHEKLSSKLDFVPPSADPMKVAEISVKDGIPVSEELTCNS